MTGFENSGVKTSCRGVTTLFSETIASRRSGASVWSTLVTIAGPASNSHSWSESWCSAPRTPRLLSLALVFRAELRVRRGGEYHRNIYLETATWSTLSCKILTRMSIHLEFCIPQAVERPGGGAACGAAEQPPHAALPGSQPEGARRLHRPREEAVRTPPLLARLK